MKENPVYMLIDTRPIKIVNEKVIILEILESCRMNMKVTSLLELLREVAKNKYFYHTKDCKVIKDENDIYFEFTIIRVPNDEMEISNKDSEKEFLFKIPTDKFKLSS